MQLGLDQGSRFRVEVKVSFLKEEALGEACVLGFCFQLHLEVRKGKASDKKWEGGFIYVTVL